MPGNFIVCVGKFYCLCREILLFVSGNFIVCVGEFYRLCRGILLFVSGNLEFVGFCQYFVAVQVFVKNFIFKIEIRSSPSENHCPVGGPSVQQHQQHLHYFTNYFKCKKIKKTKSALRIRIKIIRIWILLLKP